MTVTHQSAMRLEPVTGFMSMSLDAARLFGPSSAGLVPAHHWLRLHAHNILTLSSDSVPVAPCCSMVTSSALPPCWPVC